MIFQSSSALRFGRKVTFVFAMEPYDHRRAKRKAPWGTGPFYRVNILGGLFGLITSSSVNRSMGCRDTAATMRIAPVSCGIPPYGNPFGPPDIDETSRCVARANSGRHHRKAQTPPGAT
jgi:hypothetical protein